MSHLIAQLVQIFNSPLFTIEGKNFSLATICTIIVLIMGVIAGAIALSELSRRTILSRLNRGVQEVIAVSIQYISIILGVIIVLQGAGINLSSLTVVAGVLGIGIGLGLQNLASNFFSGLILLFEQTIKVGDYIELGTLKGTIEKITIRSTIVRTEDDVFVIVPNQKFMDNDTINWSYGGTTCRIHIPVTVAYNSDLQRVGEALVMAARAVPKVLHDPPPEVWFVSFGENGLQFEVLVWIDDPDDNEVIRSAINFRIAYEFKLRGITVPYPQRDLWIRNWQDFPTNTPQPTSTASPAPCDTPLYYNYSLTELLRRTDYFENCSESELLAVIASGDRNEYSADEIIVREGEPSECFYLILEGSVEIFSERTGKRLAVLNSGDFFGEIAVLMGVPRTATVRTLTNSILFEINRRQLQKLLAEHKNLGEQIALKLAERKKMLISMGLLSESEADKSELAVLNWVKDRLNFLFSVQL
ncbi:MAG: cyclic nucleotide-binding domain-containing protein [Pseudanabaenaceae cyanobacterium]